MSFGPDGALRPDHMWPAMWYYNANMPVAETSYANLRALASLQITMAYVTGSPTSKISGFFAVDSSDVVSADNGGNIIVDAIGRRWKRVEYFRDYKLLPQDFGVLGNGVANDGANFRTALASFPITGGLIELPTGDYELNANGAGACLAITKPLVLRGNGGIYTALDTTLASAADDSLSINPSILTDHAFSGLMSLAVHNPNTGVRTGRHGVLLDTETVGQAVAKYTVRDVLIGQGSGIAFFHLNDPAKNPDGGLFCALFENSHFKGGLRLENSGDSISVVHMILSGTGLGVNASLAAGASCLEVQACNITTTQGAVRLGSGSRPRLLGLNMEHSAVGAVVNNDSAVVNVSGAAGAIYGGVLRESLASAFGATDANCLLRVDNVIGYEVGANTFLSGAAGVNVAIRIGANAKDTRILPNGYNAGITTKVVDGGVGTMGVVKTMALLNAWVAFAVGTATFKYIKSPGDGMVHMWGTLKNGVTADGTSLGVLPVGFRPGEVICAPANFVNGAVMTPCELVIDAAGNVTINKVTASTKLSFNISFPAANLADYVSLE